MRVVMVSCVCGWVWGCWGRRTKCRPTGPSRARAAERPAAMFHLGHPDVLPVGDLGVRRGMQHLHGLKVGAACGVVEVQSHWSCQARGQAGAEVRAAPTPRQQGGQWAVPRRHGGLGPRRCSFEAAWGPLLTQPCPTQHSPASFRQSLPEPEAMEQMTESWKPYRSVGSFYMWRVSAEAPRSPNKRKKAAATAPKKGRKKADNVPMVDAEGQTP